MRIFLIILIVAVVAGMAYVRLAPTNVAQVHLPSYPNGAGDYPSSNSFMASRQITTTPQGILEILDGVIMATPRTERLAGSAEEGLVSYVTRSRIFGFPDFTTIEVGSSVDDDGPYLRIYGRARFGQSDLGVNAARIRGWLAELGPLTVPLP